MHKTSVTNTMGCAGLPPRHVVCNLTSFNELGGPIEVYVGVSEGSQKSGSLWRRASACSRSIWRRANSSASWARFSTLLESKVNFRFSPLAVEELSKLDVKSDCG